MFSEYIEKSSAQYISRQTLNRNNNNYDQQYLSNRPNTLSRIAFWGVTIAVGGLAIYLWNQTQSIDPSKYMSLGDFLNQLYRT